MTLHVTSSPRFEVHNFNLECATVDLGGPLGAINKRLLSVLDSFLDEQSILIIQF